MQKATYKDSGVDLEVYRQSMARLPRLMHRTRSPRVLPAEGGFAGLFQLDFRRPDSSPGIIRTPCWSPAPTASARKLKVARMAGKHNTVGIDLVAMCVNDALCCGAEPLFFLDYVGHAPRRPAAAGRHRRGDQRRVPGSDCALIGGETAIMPDLYQRGDYDLAGFCVGVVERAKLIDGSAIAPGDVVLGVASSGLHSNGYSLVRKIVFDIAGLTIDRPRRALRHDRGRGAAGRRRGSTSARSARC